MISEKLKSDLQAMASDYRAHSRGAGRKQLQAAFDLLLDETSRVILGEPCRSRMNYRQGLNARMGKSITPEHEELARALSLALMHDALLYNRAYDDQSDDIKKFIENHLVHILRAL